MGSNPTLTSMLSPSKLTTLQRCPRQYALEREYRLLRHRPKDLLQTLLRQAIFAISNGMLAAAAAAEASTRYLEAAARPGLDVTGDPFTIARDHCAIIQTVCEAISRLVLLSVVRTPPTTAWEPAAWSDESGTLHRWVVVEKWDDDARYRELHSWHVFGDCCATAHGMEIHAIEIGHYRKGHQHSPWCRAHKHPSIPNRSRFRKVDGTPLGPDWQPVWYQNSDKNDPKIWVDLMEADRLELVHHLSVREPLVEHVEQFHAVDVKTVEPGPWRSIGLSRPACDFPIVCPWQPVCYGRIGVEPEEAGGIVRISTGGG